MLIRATLKYLRISPRKVRRVAALMRGRPVRAAAEQLTFAAQRPAKPLLKLLKSAIANAEEQFSLKPETLMVKQVLVNGGPILKRSLPRARGKVDPLFKRTSHVELVLSGVKPTKSAVRPAVKSVKPALKKSMKTKV